MRRSNRIKARLQAQLPLLSLVGVALFLGIIIILPSHMDEFVMFHRLACWNPIQALNTFRESCPGPLTRLGIVEFHRSYAYIGIASSLIQAPIFSIFQSSAAIYITGIIFLMASIFGLQASFQLPRWTALIFILFFPLSYSVIHDGGPIRLTVLTICWTPWLIHSTLANKKYRAPLFMLLAALWLLSTEDKPFFLYLVPK